MQAKLANTYGHYIVGNIEGKYDRFIKEEAKLHEVIVLKIIPEDDQPKTFSLEEVHDLQSRLMLLGGDMSSSSLDNKQFEKEYFVQVGFIEVEKNL